MNRHPLIGKLLRWETEDGAAYTVSRFTTDLGNGFFLAMRLCPNHGTNLDMSHILSFEMLAEREGAEIYDDWDALEEAMECPHDSDGADDSEPTITPLH
jgi:hypothetical protein